MGNRIDEGLCVICGAPLVEGSDYWCQACEGKLKNKVGKIVANKHNDKGFKKRFSVVIPSLAKARNQLRTKKQVTNFILGR